MRLCFAKQPYCVEYTWESTRWPGPRELLEAYTFRTQNISLAIHFKADTWVLAGRTHVEDGWLQVLERRVPEAVDALYQSHTMCGPEDVPWGQYDVVITTDPIVPKAIIEAHPSVLWCYYECGHTTKSACYSRWAPQNGYDLYLDHYMHTATELDGLPQSVRFPYTASPGMLQGLVDMPAERVGILLDSKTTKYRRQLRGPLPRTFTKGVGRDDFHMRVARRQMTPPADWLQMMAQCRYYLLWRDKATIGQAAIEAAAMGLIVVGNGIYPRMICHPVCLMDIGAESIHDAMHRMEEIETDADLQCEILAHQHSRLAWSFWHKPIAMLRQALEMKRSG